MARSKIHARISEKTWHVFCFSRALARRVKELFGMILASRHGCHSPFRDRDIHVIAFHGRRPRARISRAMARGAHPRALRFPWRGGFWGISWTVGGFWGVSWTGGVKLRYETRKVGFVYAEVRSGRHPRVPCNRGSRGRIVGSWELWGFGGVVTFLPGQTRQDGGKWGILRRGYASRVRAYT